MDCVVEACKALNEDPDMAADLMVDFLKDAGAEASRESCVSDLDVCSLSPRLTGKTVRFRQFRNGNWENST